ncbi:unnamed protein product [Polarella glacialis]|uniref:Uncharacterized protein n=1 Tax=Polarella glacialis TaxID=89957 RepID=A0A813EED7_POLGL|nr:unnamed protein product [Polarella glacialis]
MQSLSIKNNAIPRYQKEGLCSSKSSLPSKQQLYNGILAKTSKESRVQMLPNCTSALWQGMVRNLPAVLILHLCQELHPGSFLWHFKACSERAWQRIQCGCVAQYVQGNVFCHAEGKACAHLKVPYLRNNSCTMGF